MESQVSLFELNERYNLLKRPYNAYCKSNFIDYNESVERILKMSIAYSDNSKSINGKRKRKTSNNSCKGKKKTLFSIQMPRKGKIAIVKRLLMKIIVRLVK